MTGHLPLGILDGSPIHTFSYSMPAMRSQHSTLKQKTLALGSPKTRPN
jgi:hypothetical protein